MAPSLNGENFMDLSGVFQSLPGFMQIVNVVVLLSALFFFTSTIASHLIEVYVGWRNSRGESLRNRLEKALGKEATDAFYSDPIIKSLSGGSPGKPLPPSYIEPEYFAKVVAALSNSDGPVKASAVISDIKTKLVGAADQLEPKLIDWFKAINDRENGVYTRWTFLRLLVVGFLLAATMDIDTVHIAGTLWSNPEQTEQAAQKLDNIKNLSGQLSGLSDADRKKLNDSVAAAYKDVRTFAKPTYAWQKTPPNLTWDDWLGKLLGWLLTALATSLGAQFWFNMMSEALKLRAAGRKPDDGTQKKDQKKDQGAAGGAAGGTG